VNQDLMESFDQGQGQQGTEPADLNERIVQWRERWEGFASALGAWDACRY
jgi:hypothetical protein